MRPILQIAATQGGIVTRAQALANGYSDKQIRSRVDSGKWETVIAGVYRLLPLTSWEERLRASIAGLPNAVASHESAARLLGFPSFESAGVVVSVHSQTTHRWPGATVRRAIDLEEQDLTTVGGIRSTIPARTLFDLASRLPRDKFFDLADTLASTGRVSTKHLGRCAARLCRRGKPGSSAVRDYLDQRLVLGGTSPLELRALQLLRGRDLEPVREFPLPWAPSRRFDLAFPEVKLAIELDSRAWHSSPSSFQGDRTRDREAALNGWLVLRFTWQDIESRPDEFVATVTRLIAERLRSAG